ncbi:DUF6432 family protein [Saliphagus sp. GCM10025334]|uniref:DUF6432 family protein n=1 Tax=Natronosalvus rutilus TaxID=2953753 RepID=A0A9E7NAL2_9EURY|nr:DUF6432 family protein [Natronosalvus rutilus]UTF53881.1 DUF6432 family protein [Natronosalvus rutilus]
MRAKREFRDRSTTEVAVLDALVDRTENGMTVFELRAEVAVSIDDLEEALATLKDDGLIVIDNQTSRTVIKPDERVVPDENDLDEEDSLLERLRERFSL